MPFDLYRRPSRDMMQSSLSGFLLTTLSISLSIYVILTEISYFRNPDITSEIVLGNSWVNEKDIVIEFSISFPRTLCTRLTIGVREEGVDRVTSMYEITSQGINKGGELVGPISATPIVTQNTSSMLHRGSSNPNSKGTVSNSLEETLMGCRIEGRIRSTTFPGFFSIDIDRYNHDYLWVKKAKHEVGFSYRVHYLVLKDSSSNNKFLQGGDTNEFSGQVLDLIDLPVEAILPLNNISREGKREEIFDFALRAIPTVVNTRLAHEKFYQILVSETKLSTGHFPSLRFRYDITPMVVVYSHNKYFREPLISPLSGRTERTDLMSGYLDSSDNSYSRYVDLVIRICASIGGIFTIMGVVNTLLLKMMRDRISVVGKLSKIHRDFNAMKGG